MNKLPKIVTIICAILGTIVLFVYLFKISFTEREDYGRYSFKYYWRTPETVKSLDALIHSNSREYTSILSDGPSPAMTIALYKGVDNPDSVVSACVQRLKSQSVAVIPSNTPVMEEPVSKLKAWIDVARHSANSGDITVTLFENEP